MRYLSCHRPDRVARVVFAATLPVLRKTDDNPDGIDGASLEATLAAVGEDRPRVAAGVADLWFGNGLPGVAVSPQLQHWLIGLFLQASPRAAADMFRAFTHTDLRADLAAVEVPTLIVHGDSDAMAPSKSPAAGPRRRSPTASSRCTSTPPTACSSPTGNA